METELSRERSPSFFIITDFHCLREGSGAEHIAFNGKVRSLADTLNYSCRASLNKAIKKK